MPALLLPLLLAPALAAPRVFLYTMGHGEDLFTRYGHATICVRLTGETSGDCYGYGYTDFSQPALTIWQFMRNEGVYWGEVDDEEHILRMYRRRSSDIWRQELTLTDEQRDALIQSLKDSLTGEAKYYKYHHFYDNCSTRLRDPLDRVTGGLLSRDNDTPDGVTYREIAEHGLAGNLPLQVTLQLGLGREADQHTTGWARMLMPAELRAQVEARLGARADLMFHGSTPPIPDTAQQGRTAVAAAGVALGALAGLLGWKTPRLARGVVATLLGLPAVVFWAIAAITALSELRYNETLLLLWPTDLALPWLSPERRWRYLQARLGMVVLVAVLWAVGLLIQPLGPNLCFVGLPLGVLAAGEWNRRRRGA